MRLLHEPSKKVVVFSTVLVAASFISTALIAHTYGIWLSKQMVLGGLVTLKKC